MRGMKGTSHIHGVLRSIEMKAKTKIKEYDFSKGVRGSMKSILDKVRLYDKINEELGNWEVRKTCPTCKGIRYEFCSGACRGTGLVRRPLKLEDLPIGELLWALIVKGDKVTSIRTKSGDEIVRKK